MGYKGLLNMCTGFTNVFQAEVLHTVLEQGTCHHHCLLNMLFNPRLSCFSYLAHALSVTYCPCLSHAPVNLDYVSSEDCQSGVLHLLLYE